MNLKIANQTEVIEKLNLNSKIHNLATDLQETQGSLNKLEDQADDIKKQNLTSRLNDLTNEIVETRKDLEGLEDRADEIKKQNFNSKIYNLTNELAETKEGFNELSYRLKYHGFMPTAVLILSTYNSGNKPMTVTFDGKNYSIFLVFS